MNDKPLSSKPQLIVCGHGSVDDPDGAIVYDETMSLIENEFSYLSDDIVVIRIGPSDQILNAIISLSKVVLQLSLREGFEVKVSEALHKVSNISVRSVRVSIDFECLGQTSHSHQNRRHSSTNSRRKVGVYRRTR